MTAGQLLVWRLRRGGPAASRAGASSPYSPLVLAQQRLHFTSRTAIKQSHRYWVRTRPGPSWWPSMPHGRPMPRRRSRWCWPRPVALGPYTPAPRPHTSPNSADTHALNAATRGPACCSRPDYGWRFLGGGRECVGFAGYRARRTPRSPAMADCCCAGNGPFPVVVGTWLARVPIASRATAGLGPQHRPIVDRLAVRGRLPQPPSARRLRIRGPARGRQRPARLPGERLVRRRQLPDAVPGQLHRQPRASPLQRLRPAVPRQRHGHHRGRLRPGWGELSDWLVVR